MKRCDREQVNMVFIYAGTEGESVVVHFTIFIFFSFSW